MSIVALESDVALGMAVCFTNVLTFSLCRDSSWPPY